MSQQLSILAQIFGFWGWRVEGVQWQLPDGTRLLHGSGLITRDARLVLLVERCVAARCATCVRPTKRCHQKLKKRTWLDLPWAGHLVLIEYEPIRTKCRRRKCGARGVELLPWADPYQRQTRRLQQLLAMDAASMPVLHVAWKYDLAWSTVQRAEMAALARWQAQRPEESLRLVGIDEKWLGRRHKRSEKFVTVVSNLETGEPIWIGFGRSEETLTGWLSSLTLEQKATIQLFAVDMHRAFENAIRADPALNHAALVHDPFHVMKKAGEAISDLRRALFFRAGSVLRAVGKGTRWLVLRAWERCTEQQRAKLMRLFSFFNGKLARAYQVVEELRLALRAAPDGDALRMALWRIIKRTSRYDNPMRSLCNCLRGHFHQIAALAEHRPPTGRIEALNNNWEALVRRSRGHRNLSYLLAKLRFSIANPIRSRGDARRFLALGLPNLISKPQ